MAGTGQDAVNPAIAQLLKSLGGGGRVPEGWAGVDATSPENAANKAQQAQERYEFALSIAAPFMSQAGRTSLEALRRVTIESPAWKPDELGLLNAVGYGIFHEGMNSLVRYIERMIDIAQQGPAGDAKPARSRRKA